MTRSLILALAAVALGACATMVRGTTETVALRSVPSGAVADLGAHGRCTTPCSMTLERKLGYAAVFTKPGCEKAVVSIMPHSGRAWAYSGVFDYDSGAAYDLAPNPAMAVLRCESATVPSPSP